jgi:hypothetical protein
MRAPIVCIRPRTPDHNGEAVTRTAHHVFEHTIHETIRELSVIDYEPYHPPPERGQGTSDVPHAGLIALEVFPRLLEDVLMPGAARCCMLVHADTLPAFSRHPESGCARVNGY